MIAQLLKDGKQTLSFEVFPPKKEEEFENAQAVLNSLAELKPDFISVTYGAGGSRSKKTVEIASYIQNTLRIPALAHMTCVGSKKRISTGWLTACVRQMSPTCWPCAATAPPGWTTPSSKAATSPTLRI